MMARAPGYTIKCASAPAATVIMKKAKKRTAPNRRATGVPNASSHSALKPRCVRSAWINA